MAAFNFPKRLLYLSDSRMAAYRWQQGELSLEEEFSTDAKDLTAFAVYLEKSRTIPLYLLADVIEEDFRFENIPHAVGPDRHALTQRKLGQHFRNTRFRQATFQGREKTGRRDDHVLFTALTNDKFLKPWVEQIIQLKVPLVGIYSVPMVSRELVKKLQLDDPHQLLVTWHEANGLRQNYFQQEHIKFSRLTLLAGNDAATPSEMIGRECRRTQQYLQSLKLLPRDEMLEVHVLCPDANLPQLRAEATQALNLHFQYRGLNEVAAQIGIPTTAPISIELLFLHLLSRHTPREHYAPPESTHFHLLQQTRLGIHLASAALLVGAVAWIATNLIEAYTPYKTAEKVVLETKTTLDRYQAIKSTFPPTPETPNNMKTVVELVQAVGTHTPFLEGFLIVISQALETLPEIRINSINWQLSTASATPGMPPPQTGASQPGQMAAGGIQLPPLGGKQAPNQVATIQGEITPFESYRASLNSISRFMEELRKNKSLTVVPVSMPLDTSSTAQLSGKVDNSNTVPTAKFEIRVMLKP